LLKELDQKVAPKYIVLLYDPYLAQATNLSAILKAAQKTLLQPKTLQSIYK